MKNIILLSVTLFISTFLTGQDILKYHKGSGTLGVNFGLSNTRDGKYFSAAYTEYLTDNLFGSIAIGGESGNHYNNKFSSQVIDFSFGYKIINLRNRLFINAVTILSTMNDDLNNYNENRKYNTNKYLFGYGIGINADAFITSKLIISLSASDRSYPGNSFYSHRSFATIGIKYAVK